MGAESLKSAEMPCGVTRELRGAGGLGLFLVGKWKTFAEIERGHLKSFERRQIERASETLFAANGPLTGCEALQIVRAMTGRPIQALMICPCCGLTWIISTHDSGIREGRELFRMHRVIETLRRGKMIEGGLFCR